MKPTAAKHERAAPACDNCTDAPRADAHSRQSRRRVRTRHVKVYRCTGCAVRAAQVRRSRWIANRVEASSWPLWGCLWRDLPRTRSCSRVLARGALARPGASVQQQRAAGERGAMVLTKRARRRIQGARDRAQRRDISSALRTNRAPPTDKPASGHRRHRPVSSHRATGSRDRDRLEYEYEQQHNDRELQSRKRWSIQHVWINQPAHVAAVVLGVVRRARALTSTTM
jgi:hypothetical protein